MDKPDWREFTDTERLDWLMNFIRNPLVSRRSIDEAIARDEFRGIRKPASEREKQS